MKKLFTTFALLFAVTIFAKAQTDAPATPVSEEQECKKFFFAEPVLELKSLKYHDGTELKGELSEDGREVRFCDEQVKGSVYATVVRKDGTEEEIRKTPCDMAKAKMFL